MCHGRSLRYAVLLVVILKFIFIVSATHPHASDTTVLDSEEEIDEDYILQLRNTLGDKKFEKFKKYFDKTGFKRGNETGFKCGTDTGIRIGYKMATEEQGWAAFLCAIGSIKGTLETLSKHPELHSANAKHQKLIIEEVKQLSELFSKTKSAITNKTRDGWIHESLMEARKQKKQGRQGSSTKSNFVYEVDLTFGQCVYFLKREHPPLTFAWIPNLLVEFYNNLTASERQEVTLNQTKYEFCGTIARSYHLANAIVQKYHVHIMNVRKTTQGEQKFFYHALLEVIPYWYMSFKDITFLNIFRYSVAESLNSRESFVPIVPYGIKNYWKETGGPDLVVIPLLYNSLECGSLPSDKGSTSPPPAQKFALDLGDIPIERPTKWVWRKVRRWSSETSTHSPSLAPQKISDRYPKDV